LQRCGLEPRGRVEELRNDVLILERRAQVFDGVFFASLEMAGGMTAYRLHRGGVHAIIFNSYGSQEINERV